MAFNALDAARMLSDNVLTDEEIKLLIDVRDGVALNTDETYEPDEKDLKALQAMGLVQGFSFSSPRSTASIPGLVPTEAGQTLLNEIDKRYRENGFGAIAPYDRAPRNVDPAPVRQPTERDAEETATTKEGKAQAIARLEGTDTASKERAKYAKEQEKLEGSKTDSEELMKHINPSDPRTPTFEEKKREREGKTDTVATGATVKVEKK